VRDRASFAEAIESTLRELGSLDTSEQRRADDAPGPDAAG
jgi:hypothetical protein